MKRILIVIMVMFPLVAKPQATAPLTFSGLNVRDGAEVSLSDFSGKPGVVVIFTGYQCAVDEYYRLRIRELISKYADQVPFVLVNSYIEAAEGVDKMQMEAVANGYTVPYLADKEQKIMNILGARKSPEVFVLKNNSGSFSVMYSGAIDDNPQLPSGVKERYLDVALANLLSGKSVITSVRATGCTIRRR